LSEPWDGGVATTTPAGGQDDEVQGSWDGEMGQYDEEDFALLPAAIRNLNNPVAMRSYDLSGMGPGSDAILTDCDELESYDWRKELRWAMTTLLTIKWNWSASYRLLSFDSD
jgi:hypothetical protein